MKNISRIVLFTFASVSTCLAQDMWSQQEKDIKVGTLPEAPGVLTTEDKGALPAAPTHDVDLKGLPVRFLKDESGIFTAPLRISRSDLKWLVPLAGATAAALQTDTYTSETW